MHQGFELIWPWLTVDYWIVYIDFTVGYADSAISTIYVSNEIYSV